MRRQQPGLLLLAGLLLPATAMAEGGYTGLLTLVVGLPGMLLALLLLAICRLLARHRAARMGTGLLLVAVCVLGACVAGDALALIRSASDGPLLGGGFLALWAANLAVGGSTWLRRGASGT